MDCMNTQQGSLLLIYLMGTYLGACQTGEQPDQIRAHPRHLRRCSYLPTSCLIGTYPCVFCSLTNYHFHLRLTREGIKNNSQVVNVYPVLPTPSGRQQLLPNGTDLGTDNVRLPSRNWVLLSICVGVDTKVIMAIGLRQQKQ